MKKKTMKVVSRRLLLFLFTICLFIQRSEAYTYISASNTVSSPFPFITQSVDWYQSSASIDYCPSSSCGSPMQLSAMLTETTNNTSFGIRPMDVILTDNAGHTIDLLNQGLSSTPPYSPSTIPSGATYPSTPGGTNTQFWYWTSTSSPGSYPYYFIGGADVVLGNYISGGTVSPTTFILGIFYTMATSTGFGTLYLDRYTITGAGTSSFAAAYLNTTAITTARGLAGGGARADIIADYGSLVSGTSRPLANKFVVMWDDINGVSAYSSTLDNPSSGSTVNVVSSSTYAMGELVYDVACSQEYTGTTYNDVAHFTYVDKTNNLYYVKWYPPAGTLSGSPTFLASGQSFPRIAAIRDPALVNSTNNNWLVISENSATYGTLTAYSDQNTSGFGTISLPIATPPSNFAEGGVVSVAPGNQYAIGTYDLTYYNINTVQFTPSPAPAIDNIAYRVNTLSNSITATPDPDQFGLSSSCNTSNDLFTGWCSISSCPVCQEDFYYKQTSGSLSFKPAPANKIAIPAKLKVYPNPSADILTISSDFTSGDSYTVTDMTGKTLLLGNIQSNSQVVDVHTLPNGVYTISITGAKASDKVNFVKQ